MCDFDLQVELWCDGYRVALPALEGIIILNIKSYAGGVDLWSSCVGKPCIVNPSEAFNTRTRSSSNTSDNNICGENIAIPASMHDKMVEVVGVHGSFHMAKIQVGLSSPIPLCQGQEIIIRTHRHVKAITSLSLVYLWLLFPILIIVFVHRNLFVTIK